MSCEIQATSHKGYARNVQIAIEIVTAAKQKHFNLEA